MNILLDTNIFIPLEPTDIKEISQYSGLAKRLHRLAVEARVGIYLHPAIAKDIDRDTSQERARLHKDLLEKYSYLPDPPQIAAKIEKVLGKVIKDSNDWVDHLLLAALDADAVDFLITEDRNLKKKAERLGHDDRVLTISEGVDVISDLFECLTLPPPAVQMTRAHTLNADDPIFQSFRQDYPSFNGWLTKCKREHRLSWTIGGDEGKLAAFCIVKKEDDNPYGLGTGVLKICSFKVSDSFNGFRYGELLLKAVFDYAYENKYKWSYITAFEKHGKLIELLRDFGFYYLERRSALGELIMVKPLTQDGKSTGLDPLSYHIRHGPGFFRLDVPWYLIPIRYEYAAVLFPETASNLDLFPGRHAFGNALRKAYLCHSPTKSIAQGCILLFYRSHQERGIVAIGIAEETFRSKYPDEIARKVAKRTVYSFDEIEKLCQSEVLGILFRQAKIIKPPLPPEELINKGVFFRPPQSITGIKEGSLEWLKNRLMT